MTEPVSDNSGSEPQHPAEPVPPVTPEPAPPSGWWETVKGWFRKKET